ncbi:hypothetical protein HDK77DRAFT_182656 [Phyllosticta capitalensis]
MSSTNNNNNNQTSANPDDNNNNNTAPSLITSHASYAVGAAESTIGSLTSNASLQQSGESTKHQAVEDMRAADNAGSSSSNTATTTTTTQGGSGSAGGLAAKAEEAVGGIVGCGGLQEKGAQAQAKQGKVKEA